jgi:glucose-1-phosphate thymidylyltransferase
MKGIILAGGSGTRLYPLTAGVSKHLLPIFDKPMIYYPFTTLLLAGVKELFIVTRSRDKEAYESLFGDGKRFGIEIRYVIQEKPKGIVDGILQLDPVVQHGPCWVILGDNMFFGSGLGTALRTIPEIAHNKAMVFLKDVENPSEFGVAHVEGGTVRKVYEKPEKYVSSLCVTGLYFFGNDLWTHARRVQPSKRGETEISALLNIYAESQMLMSKELGRGSYWLDTGSARSLHEASSFVQSVQSNQKDLVGSPEIAALIAGNVDALSLRNQVLSGPTSTYTSAILRFIDNLGESSF